MDTWSILKLMLSTLYRYFILDVVYFMMRKATKKQILISMKMSRLWRLWLYFTSESLTFDYLFVFLKNWIIKHQSLSNNLLLWEFSGEWGCVIAESTLIARPRGKISKCSPLSNQNQARVFFIIHLSSLERYSLMNQGITSVYWNEFVVFKTACRHQMAFE